MNNFEKLRSMSIDDLASWLDENGIIDHSPWLEHFSDKYCAKCDPVMCKYEDVGKLLDFEPFDDDCVECAYCEIYKKCRYFEEQDNVPDGAEMVKLWLEAEVE